MPIHVDMPGPVDIATPQPDLTDMWEFTAPDLAKRPIDFAGVDLTGVDLATPPDLSKPTDFSFPTDISFPTDLGGPDLSPPPGDLGRVDLSQPADLGPNKCAGVVCNDGNPCTDDFCNPANGQCTTRAHSCNDNDACTFDFCLQQQGGCVHIPLPNNFPCNDGNGCTTNDRCQNRVCVGTTRNCSDGNSCTIDSCDPTSGTCQHAAGPAGALCDDNNPCTSTDTCQGGVCKGTAIANGASCIVTGGAGCCSAGNCCLGGGCVCM